MKVIIDIECNRLENPDKIWVVVCKCVDTGKVTIFRKLTDDPQQAEAFRQYAATITHYVGHNILGFDLLQLESLGYILPVSSESVTDTLILSKLINYSRPGGHSLEQYGKEFGLEKGKFSKWSEWSQEMEDYCARDVEISDRVYRYYLKYITDSKWSDAIWLEQRFQLIVNDLHRNGYGFNVPSCRRLLDHVARELAKLDEQILKAFPPREVLIKEFCPKLTKFGTINKASVPRLLHPEIHKYEAGKTYRHTKLEPFNPSSHKQLIEVLWEAKWRPEDRTQTHIEADRAKDKEKLIKLKESGWKINENNLSTLPKDAPEGARLLAKRILLEARRRTLTEWISLVSEDGRIHGSFYGIGAWTHRMAHQKPNTANIPSEFKEDGTPKLLGREMRALWRAPKNRLLVGVDAEGIQLRVFAHYIDDEEFTDALVKGRKEDKTDPHSLNQRILGNICTTRQAAKRFVYALLLGAGMQKLAAILGCSVSEAKEALDRLLGRYTGFKRLKKTIIPHDAKRGFFVGLDGRDVLLPGSENHDRQHLAMSGYLQNGESILVKRAGIIIDNALHEEKRLRKWLFCDIVHDEFVMESRNDVHFAKMRLQKVAEEAIAEAGRIYKLKCPMKGDGKVGLTWADIH